MTLDEFFRIADAIFRDLNIISANTQLNIAKAKIAAANSFLRLCESFLSKKIQEIDKEKASMSDAAGLLAEATMMGTIMAAKQKQQEFLNLFKLSPLEWFKGSKNAPARNSEDYLTYKLKQGLFKKRAVKAEKTLLTGLEKAAE